MRARSGSADVSRPGSGSGSGDGSAERDTDEAATAQGGCHRDTLGSVPTAQLLSSVFQDRQRMGAMQRCSRTVTSPLLSMLHLHGPSKPGALCSQPSSAAALKLPHWSTVLSSPHKLWCAAQVPSGSGRGPASRNQRPPVAGSQRQTQRGRR